MTSYLRKYVTALASAKDYIATWSSDHVYADEELIVPFPTIAVFNPDKHVWTVHIKAWVYLPFQSKSLTSYLPSLPSFLGGSSSNETKKDEEFVDAHDGDPNKLKESKSTENVKVDADKKEAAAILKKENQEIKKTDESSDEASEPDDDIYEDALRKYLFF